MKTQFYNVEASEKKWYEIDAENVVLGKLAVKCVELLKGKNKPEYSPDRDCGDFVIVTNASKIKVTGNKLKDKKYFKFTGYIGNYQLNSLEDLLEKKPEQVIKLAVKGMLPKNRLGRKILKKLKVYTDNNHKHQAQKPEKVEL